MHPQVTILSCHSLKRWVRVNAICLPFSSKAAVRCCPQGGSREALVSLWLSEAGP